jgi:hypothetical protein
VRFAISPNDPRVAILVGSLEVDGVPIAEVWRQVGSAAERLSMGRPSYSHVRRLVRVECRRRVLERQGRAVLGRAASTMAAGRVPSAVFVLERLRELELRKELVIQEHKAFAGRDVAAPDASATEPGRRSRGPSGPRRLP